MKTTTNNTNEGISLLQKDSFDPRFAHWSQYPVMGSSLHHDSGEGDELGLDEWIECKFEELGIDGSDYVHIVDVLCDEEEFHLSAVAGLNIAETFDNEIGDAARHYLDKVAKSNKVDDSGVVTPVQMMLAKLQRHQKKMHKLLEDATRWYNIGKMHKPYSTAPSKQRHGNESINAAYSEDVSDLAKDKMLHAGTRSFNNVLKIVSEMAGIYYSPLYTEAATRGYAPRLTDNTQTH